MSNSRLHDLLALAHVPRWSIVPHCGSQSVAEHSYRVAAIALSIADRLNNFDLPSSVVIKAQVLQWAIVHDGPEAETGDVPYPVKSPTIKAELAHLEATLCPWYEAEVSRVHPQEYAVVKISDKIEEVLFLREYGIGLKAIAAADSARQQILAHVEDARHRYGWADLPAIVQDILDADLGLSPGPDGPGLITTPSHSPDAGNSEGLPSPARTPHRP